MNSNLPDYTSKNQVLWGFLYGYNGSMILEEKYPFIASWVVDGEINIGRLNEYDQPMAAVIDHGGLVWHTEEEMTLDDVFDAMERAIGLWCREYGIELVDRKGNGIPFPED